MVLSLRVYFLAGSFGLTCFSGSSDVEDLVRDGSGLLCLGLLLWLLRLGALNGLARGSFYFRSWDCSGGGLLGSRSSGLPRSVGCFLCFLLGSLLVSFSLLSGCFLVGFNFLSGFLPCFFSLLSLCLLLSFCLLGC